MTCRFAATTAESGFPTSFRQVAPRDHQGKSLHRRHLRASDASRAGQSRPRNCMPRSRAARSQMPVCVSRMSTDISAPGTRRTARWRCPITWASPSSGISIPPIVAALPISFTSVNAAAAIAAGKCSVALVTLAGRPRTEKPFVRVPGPEAEFEAAYGGIPANLYAMCAMRHMYDYGTTSDPQWRPSPKPWAFRKGGTWPPRRRKSHQWDAPFQACDG